MKYLLVLLVVLVAFWIWRNNRRLDSAAREAARKPKARPQPLPPTVMVACHHCGAHLPEADAAVGTDGVYCCVEHRQQHEQGR